MRPTSDRADETRPTLSAALAGGAVAAATLMDRARAATRPMRATVRRMVPRLSLVTAHEHRCPCSNHDPQICQYTQITGESHPHTSVYAEIQAK